MLNFYNILFYGTFLTIEKFEKMDQGESLYQAFSAILCLITSHFLFLFSVTILFFPSYSSFSLKSIFLILFVLSIIFWGLFVRAEKYKQILTKYNNQKRKAFIISSTTNGLMVGMFFIMAGIQILKA